MLRSLLISEKNEYPNSLIIKAITFHITKDQIGNDQHEVIFKNLILKKGKYAN